MYLVQRDLDPLVGGEAEPSGLCRVDCVGQVGRAIFGGGRRKGGQEDRAQYHCGQLHHRQIFKLKLWDFIQLVV